MGEFWKSIEPAVTAALLTLIPVLGFAVRSWLQSRARHWESAQDARQEAVALGESFPGEVSEQVLETWAVKALQRRNPKLTDAAALALVKRVTAAEPDPVPLDRERITVPSPGVVPGPGSDPPRSG